MRQSTRQPINIDPNVRTALRRHLMSDKYMGTGVGYSEFIRRAIEADGGDPGPAVRPDNRWGGTYEPDNLFDGPRQEFPKYCPHCGVARFALTRYRHHEECPNGRT